MAYRNRVPPKDMRAPLAVGMPIKEVRLLPERERAEFVSYHARQAALIVLVTRFNIRCSHPQRGVTIQFFCFSQYFLSSVFADICVKPPIFFHDSTNSSKIRKLSKKRVAKTIEVGLFCMIRNKLGSLSLGK